MWQLGTYLRIRKKIFFLPCLEIGIITNSLISCQKKNFEICLLTFSTQWPFLLFIIQKSLNQFFWRSKFQLWQKNTFSVNLKSFNRMIFNRLNELTKFKVSSNFFRSLFSCHFSPLLKHVFFEATVLYRTIARAQN